MKHIGIGVRDRDPGAPPPQKKQLWKTMEMLGNADLSEKILNSVYFITILHTNPGKLSTAATAPPPPGKHESRKPMHITLLPHLKHNLLCMDTEGQWLIVLCVKHSVFHLACLYERSLLIRGSAQR